MLFFYSCYRNTNLSSTITLSFLTLFQVLLPSFPNRSRSKAARITSSLQPYAADRCRLLRQYTLLGKRTLLLFGRLECPQKLTFAKRMQ